MSGQNWFSKEVQQLLEEPAARLVWEEEGLLGSFALMVERELNNQKMSKSDLARKIGKSPQAVSRALGGAQNLSVRSMLEIAMALGRNVKVELPPLENLPVAESVTQVGTLVINDWKNELPKTPYQITGVEDAATPEVCLA
jgi:transcriptional regulator with XRE-family HTH domain